MPIRLEAKGGCPTVKLRGREVLEAFITRHAAARVPLDRWQRVILNAEWRNFADLRRTFSSADQVRVNRELVATVFNVGGNKYRLISEVVYATGIVETLTILTHADYDKGRWKGTLAT